VSPHGVCFAVFRNGFAVFFANTAKLDFGKNRRRRAAFFCRELLLALILIHVSAFLVL
jgi:hypothetical protein